MTHDDAHAYTEFRDQMRRFAREQVAPHAAAVDRDKRPSPQALQASTQLGLPGLPYPEALGGQDGDMLSQCILIEELARACASTALTVSSSWILMAVVDYGTEEQQREFLPGIVRGEHHCAWGLTEPAGGSDLMATRTSAVVTGEGWTLDGTKRFITNGGWADWYLIFARNGDSGHSLFLVHRDDPGVSFGAPERKMGMNGSPTSDVILDAVRVPASRLLGQAGQGGKYIGQALLRSRLHIAAHALGIAAGALHETLGYTGQREQFGQPIAKFQLVRAMVADMTIKVEAARATLHRAVALFTAGDPEARLQASVAKVLCSDAAMAVTTDAVQLHGGYGYLEDYAVERMMRDAKVTQIWEGTNQIQRLLIAKEIYDRGC